MRKPLLFALLPLLAAAALGRPMQLEDLFRVHRVGSPQVSPDGKWVVYVVTDPIKAENKTTSSLWTVPVAGGESRQLTQSPRHDGAPHWSPDGKWIAFESDRSGSNQIWTLALAGGDPRQVTTISTEASQPVWAPDGKSIAFVSAVYPQFSGRKPAEADRLNRELLETRAKSKVKARLFTELLYRHWDSWVEDRAGRCHADFEHLQRRRRLRFFSGWSGARLYHPADAHADRRLEHQLRYLGRQSDDGSQTHLDRQSRR